jgi:hypothetical protein
MMNQGFARRKNDTSYVDSLKNDTPYIFVHSHIAKTAGALKVGTLLVDTMVYAVIRVIHFLNLTMMFFIR